MNSRQYERMAENRRGYRAARLFGAEELAGLVGAAAAGVRGRGVAEEAWGRVAPPGALAASAVESFKDGVLYIAAADPTTRYWLDQQTPVLQQRLGGLLPGLREVRFVLRRDRAGRGRGDV